MAIGKEEFVERMVKDEGISQVTAKKVYDIFTRTMSNFIKEKKSINILKVITITIDVKPKRKELDSRYNLKQTKARLRVSSLITKFWD